MYTMELWTLLIQPIIAMGEVDKLFGIRMVNVTQCSVSVTPNTNNPSTATPLYDLFTVLVHYFSKWSLSLKGVLVHYSCKCWCTNYVNVGAVRTKCWCTGHVLLVHCSSKRWWPSHVFVGGILPFVR